MKWIEHFCQDMSKTSRYFSKIWVWSVDLLSWQGLCWIFSHFIDFEGNQTIFIYVRCKNDLSPTLKIQRNKVIYWHGYFGTRTDGWESFTKHYPRKCLIDRIEIYNEVNNDWRSCKKKEPLAIQSVIIVLTSHILEAYL